jgi:hypothetical protein
MLLIMDRFRVRPEVNSIVAAVWGKAHRMIVLFFTRAPVSEL